MIGTAGVTMTILALSLLFLIFLVSLAIFSVLKEIKEANDLANNQEIILLTSIQKTIEDVHFSTIDVKEAVESLNLELTPSTRKIEQTLSALEGAAEKIAGHPAFSVSVAQDDNWSDCFPD